jgi:hypothetical protein
MLKPGMLIFYVIFALIWFTRLIIKKERTRFIKYELTSFCLSIILLLGFSYLNKKQNDHFGLSTVVHDNNFINVILSGAYRNFPDETLISVIDSMKSRHYSTVYYLNNDAELYQKRYKTFPEYYAYTSDMQGISRLQPNKYGYNRAQMEIYVKDAMRSNEYINYVWRQFTGFTHSGVLYFIKGYVVYLAILLELLLLGYSLFYQKKIHWERLFVVMILIGVLSTVLIGGINDNTRSRVLTPATPFLVILFMELIDLVTSLIIRKETAINLKT